MIFMYKNALLAVWVLSHISHHNTPLTAGAGSFLLPAIFITAEKIVRGYFSFSGFFCLFVWSFFLLAKFSHFSDDDVQQHGKQCSQISSSFSKALGVISGGILALKNISMQMMAITTIKYLFLPPDAKIIS